MSGDDEGLGVGRVIDQPNIREPVEYLLRDGVRDFPAPQGRGQLAPGPRCDRQLAQTDLPGHGGRVSPRAFGMSAGRLHRSWLTADHPATTWRGRAGRSHRTWRPRSGSDPVR